MKQKVSVPFMLLGILFNVCLIADYWFFLFLILSMIALLRCGAFVKHVSLSGVVLL